MSKIALSGNASGSGTLTLSAPNTNSDRVLNLPDNSGTLLSNASTAGFPAGSVLQVVSANNTTDQTITTATPTLIVEASITPTSATSKILILYNWNSLYKTSSAEGFFRINYNGSELIGVDGITPYNGSSNPASSGSVAGSYLHSPETTSSATYGLYLNSNGSYGVRINTEGGVTTVTLMEIAA